MNTTPCTISIDESNWYRYHITLTYLTYLTQMPRVMPWLKI